MEFWIYMLRQWNDNLVIGPYPNQEAAIFAMQEALLIEGLVQEDCLDCWVSDGPSTEENFEWTQLIIDPTERHHTGKSS